SYYIIRTQAFQPVTREYLQLRLPLTFWLSTVTLIFVSGFLQASVWAVRREYQTIFCRFLVFAWIAALAFLGIQYFGLMELIQIHFTQADGSTKAYGLCFTMALLHALHVLGGMVFLGFVIWQAFHERYDHERNYAVEHCAAYWHFLDVVWVSMLLTFLITG
ncbi:MAG: cytochrome c oxidase subunit 3, partial [Pirellulaceae bacterium]